MYPPQLQIKMPIPPTPYHLQTQSYNKLFTNLPKPSQIYQKNFNIKYENNPFDIQDFRTNKTLFLQQFGDIRKLNEEFKLEYYPASFIKQQLGNNDSEIQNDNQTQQSGSSNIFKLKNSQKKGWLSFGVGNVFGSSRNMEYNFKCFDIYDTDGEDRRDKGKSGNKRKVDDKFLMIEEENLYANSKMYPQQKKTRSNLHLSLEKQKQFNNEVRQSNSFFSHQNQNPQKNLQQKSILKRSQFILVKQQQKIDQQFQAKLDFKIKVPKPPSFMGAFSHVQSQNSMGIFNLNIDFNNNVLKDQNPFSGFLASGYGLRPSYQTNDYQQAVNRKDQKSNKILNYSSLSLYESQIKSNNILAQIKSSQSQYIPSTAIQKSQQFYYPQSHQKKPFLQNSNPNFQPTSKTLKHPPQQSNLYCLSSLQPSYIKKLTQQQQILQKVFQLGIIDIFQHQQQKEQISVIKESGRNGFGFGDNQQNQNDRSIWDNYKVLLEKPEFQQVSMWESRVMGDKQNKNNKGNANLQNSLLPYVSNNNIDFQQQSNPIIMSTFQIYYPWHQSQMQIYESHFNKKSDITFFLSDYRLFISISQMLQGIQNKLFMLDYEKLQWYIDIRGLRFQHVLRESLEKYLSDVIRLANMRSRLDKVVEYVKLRPYRKIYYHISDDIMKVLQLFQQTILQMVEKCYFYYQLKQQQQKQHDQQNNHDNSSKNFSNNNHNLSQRQGFLQYLSNIQSLQPQIKLLYQIILIDQQTIQKQNMSYFMFDYRFLKSQFQIFLTVLRLSKQIDSTNSTVSGLVKSLLKSCFKPILNSLQNILFNQMVEIAPKDDIYLKYYFQSTKELFINLSKRMELVRQESPNQLYMVCRESMMIELKFNVEEIKMYDNIWGKLWYRKYFQLQKILSKMITKQNQTKNILKKQKYQQLLELKTKLRQKQHFQNQIKKSQKQRKDIQLQMLKKQIYQKEQRKRLQELINKQRQKSYLLEDQLKKKNMLLKEKERLLGDKGRMKDENQNDIGLIRDNVSKQVDKQVKEEVSVKKWNKQDGSENLNNKIQEQKLEQIVYLPVVNEPINQDIKSSNIINIQQNQSQKQIKQPVSPKSDRSRKIRKNTKRTKVQKQQSQKVQIANDIFNSNMKIPIPKTTYFQQVYQVFVQSKSIQNQNNQLNQQKQLVNYEIFSQKYKKLIFEEKFQLVNDDKQPMNQVEINRKIAMQQEEFSISQQDDEQKMEIEEEKQILDRQKLGKGQNKINNEEDTHNSFGIATYIPTSCMFQTCIDKIISNQLRVINNCYQIIIFQKYHLQQLLKFMKSIFMSENGQNIKNLLSLSINNTNSSFSIKTFQQCFLFDNLSIWIDRLKPKFYNMRKQSVEQIQNRMMEYGRNQVNGLVNGYYGEFNLIKQNLQQFVGFQFGSLPQILQPYFSYIHLSKYIQILSFLLRIKHCQSLISQSWKLLNQYKKQFYLKKKSSKLYKSHQMEMELHFQGKLLNQLFVTRHIIQSFLTTYQNYIFFRVIQKQYKILNKKLLNKDLQQLPNSHLRLLDNIIRYAFIDNQTNNITKQIRKLLQFIREFVNVVMSICVDDVREEQKDDIRIKIKFIYESFKQNQKFFEALYFKNG